ncbi:pilus assembly protein PilP [Pseudomonas mosselii]|uniref:pilus assembly protein PilP n=1 Tax=unclassified Pseudomonas TaxID=196821 RepID=UPI001F3B9DB8|nr:MULTISPECIES: pilus assembly protein PilP [unclassified Pseudomonas]MCF1488396.1 pilus assembly protein PilP [Pseudomonas sp. AA27]MDD7785635.1 pilus assembly protein PilP [Pseudomonas sp. DVZ24]
MVCLALVLMVACVGYLVRLRDPVQGHVESVRLQLQLQDELEERGARLVELGVEQQALEHARVLLQAARWRLAAGEGMSELLDQLALSGHEHGLVFERVEVQEAQQASVYRVQPLEIAVSGQYPALRLWLEQWLRQLRLLNVERLRLVLKDEGIGRVDAQLRLHAYHPGEELPVPASLADEPAQAILSKKTAFDPFRAWSPPREGGDLAHVPLARLEMVGSLSRAGWRQALLRSGGRLYRIAQGERLGLEGGVVVAIEFDRVEVHERFYIDGRWQARPRYLVLGTREQGEVRDETDERVERRAIDAGAADGAGRDVSG